MKGSPKPNRLKAIILKFRLEPLFSSDLLNLPVDILPAPIGPHQSPPE